MDTRTVELDLAEIDRRLDLANRLTEPAYVKMPDYHPEYFPIFDIAGRELRDKGLLINWRAHLAGLRHKTTNVIFITPVGKLILQRRAPTTILFPSRYSLSAGGHVSHTTPGRNEPIDPLTKLQEEVLEELGLRISRARFTPLGDADRGLPNFLHAWTYQHDGTKAMFTVFDASAKNIGVSYDRNSKTPLTQSELDSLTELICQETLSNTPETIINQSHLSLFTRNIELCHFYTVSVSEEEIASIRFTDGEVAGFRRVTLDAVVDEARKLDTTTDSLYTLFFDRTDIVAELNSRIEEVRR